MRICVFIAASLDGYIATTDGGIDWLKTVEVPDQDYGYSDFVKDVDCLVVGRKTFEKVLSFDPYPYADKRVIVLSSSSKTSKRGEEYFSGHLKDLMVRLQSAGMNKIYIDGGVAISSALAEGLIGELTVSTVPVILGSGIPLFSGLESQIPLKLDSMRSFPSGLIQAKYIVA